MQHRPPLSRLPALSGTDVVMVDTPAPNLKTFSLPGDEFPSDAGYSSPSYYAARYESLPQVPPGALRYARNPSAPYWPVAEGARGGLPPRDTDAVGPLVTHTESVHAKVAQIDQKTGEIQAFTVGEGCSESALKNRASRESQQSARTERYQLQRVAREALIDLEPPAVGKNARRTREALTRPLMPIIHGVPCRQQRALATGLDLTFTDLQAPRPAKRRAWRVTFCNWRALDDVKVMLSPEHNKAHFKNVAVCGSVWTCPVCAAKVSQRRGLELKTASEAHVEAGGSLLMCTLTFSHSRHDDLKALVGDSKRSHGLTSALQRFRNSRTYKRIKADLGMMGLVRNLEVTHSEANGWHPHVHELWFVDGGVSSRQLARYKAELFVAWRAACGKAGLALPNRKRGLDLRVALTADEYMTKFGTDRKWSPEAELTRSHSKKSLSQSMTPFDLLRCIGAGSQRAQRCRQLFREYAYAFFGRAQLYWTPGLKACFGIDEKTDDQLAREEAADAIEATTISRSRWKRVLRLPFEGRDMVLRLAESGGGEAVDRFLYAFFGPDLSRAFFHPLRWSLLPFRS